MKKKVVSISKISNLADGIFAMINKGDNPSTLFPFITISK